MTVTSKARKGSTSYSPSAVKPKKRPDAAAQKAEKSEVRIFVSYSHADDAYREKLEKHLAPLKREGVTTWFDGDIHAGEELDPEISRALRRAHLFIALISSNYLSSHYCWKKEYLRAMGRRARGSMRVVGVVLKPCDWKQTKAAGFKQLPKDGRAVSDWRSADHALLDVTSGIREVVKVIRKELETATPRFPEDREGMPRVKHGRAPKLNARKPASKPVKAAPKPRSAKRLDGKASRLTGNGANASAAKPPAARRTARQPKASRKT